MNQRKLEDDMMEAVEPFEKLAKPKYAVPIRLTESKTVDGAFYLEAVYFADRDYYEILPDGKRKNFFTFREIMDSLNEMNNEWRLPTQTEWMAACIAFGTGENGEVAYKTLMAAMNLWSFLGIHLESGDDHSYWTSTFDCSMRNYVHVIRENDEHLALKATNSIARPTRVRLVKVDKKEKKE